MVLDAARAGLSVDLDLGDVGGEGVGRRGADRAAAVVAAELGRVVAAAGAQRAVARLGELEGLADGHAPVLRVEASAQRDPPASGPHSRAAPALGQRPGDQPAQLAAASRRRCRP